MSYKCGEYKIVGKRCLAENIYSFTIHCPEAAELAHCGQFVHILAPGFTLRRPVSICEISKDNGDLRIVFLVKGHGTEAIARLNEGDMIDMIAPLGNGYSLPPVSDNGRVIVVGGGIGVPPLLETAKQLKNVTAVLGFRSYGNIILEKEFRAVCDDVIICTDDGSVGEKGIVTGPLKRELEKGGVSAVFSCGPTRMLCAVAELTKQYGVFCEVSLEERMGCGVGACVGCVARINRNGEEKLLRVCKDGPVFNAGEVLF
ncbi:MAG TPA: dihydroorotate dehydrogenase electron transfer subunit [Ruminococcaceae bacterium]|nr:dihydroorotate dehydrogenase electron transfer subunit [Oscillospiraceae bacterium]